MLGGCAVGGGGEDQEGTGFRDEYAEAARPLTTTAGTETTAVGGATSTTAGRGAGTTSTTARAGSAGTNGTGGSSGGPQQTTTTTAAPFAARLDVVDAPGDGGLEKPPPYGDLTRLRMEEDGRQIRVTVEMAGDVPARIAAGEQVSIGVDLWRGGRESEYQLFALGTDEGWRAWLDTPEDEVPYPGTFEVGGRSLVFTVPWPSLGGRRAGALSVFAEWTKDRTAVLASFSADRAPDQGDRPYSL